MGGIVAVKKLEITVNPGKCEGVADIFPTYGDKVEFVKEYLISKNIQPPELVEKGDVIKKYFKIETKEYDDEDDCG